MRKLSFIFASLLLVVTMYAQDLKAIKLSSPDKNRGSSVMKALSDRHSDREYAAKELSLQDLSDLLWAANGINRPDGKRTAPSALNKQDIDIYVIMKEGAYLYDAKANSLQPIAKGDHRCCRQSGFCQISPSQLGTRFRSFTLRKHCRPHQTDGRCRCRHRLPKHQYFLRSHRSGNRSPCHDGPGCFKTDLETNGQPIADHEQSGGIST